MFALFMVCATPPQYTVVNKCPPVVVNRMPAPEVAAPRPFQSVRHHPGHHCPTCGRYQSLVSAGSKFGIHAHTCPNCRTVWSH